MKKILFLFILSGCTQLYAQDYTRYYQRIDSSALYFNQPKQADSMYALAFAEQIGFPQDYENAIGAHHEFTGELSLEYVIGGFTGGLRKKQLTAFLKSQSIPYKKRTIRRLYREHRVKRSVGTLPVWKLLRKDQKARRDYRHVREADSLNAIELIRLIREKPELFDRHKTGWLRSEMVKILIIHQEYRNIAVAFPELRELVREGKLHREALSLLIDRNAISGGEKFGIGPMGELSYIPGGNARICPEQDSYCYSATGEFCPYFQHSGYLLLPVDPRTSAAEIDALRAYLFLSPLELFHASHPYFPVYTAGEFCEKLREGRAKAGAN